MVLPTAQLPQPLLHPTRSFLTAKEQAAESTSSAQWQRTGGTWGATCQHPQGTAGAHQALGGAARYVQARHTL